MTGLCSGPADFCFTVAPRFRPHPVGGAPVALGGAPVALGGAPVALGGAPISLRGAPAHLAGTPVSVILGGAILALCGSPVILGGAVVALSGAVVHVDSAAVALSGAAVVLGSAAGPTDFFPRPVPEPRHPDLADKAGPTLLRELIAPCSDSQRIYLIIFLIIINQCLLPGSHMKLMTVLFHEFEYIALILSCLT